MSEKEVNLEIWLRGSRQRQAVALCIQRPMANSEIAKAARAFVPSIGRWDVSKIVRHFMERGLVYCINPEVHTGKLFWLTDYGRDIIGAAFHRKIAAKSDRVDWRGYSFLVAAPLRRLVLEEAMEVARHRFGPQTCVAIRRRLYLSGRSFSIYHVMRAVFELRGRKLLRCVRYTKKRHLRMYSITVRGKTVLEELTRE